MEQLNDRWFVIVNPVAGRGRGLLHWPQISTLLQESGILFDAWFTQRKHHATELTVQAIRQGYRQVVVVGGDGTIHETVCGIFLQKEVKTTQVLIAVIAVGTGNDWIRMFGIARSYAQAVRSIVQGYSFLQDVGQMCFFESRVAQTSYMANVSGIGYDAAVCRGFNTLREKGYKGNILYVWSALKQAFRYKSRQAQITVDGREVFSGKLFTATIGVCKYTGGGMSQTPYAIADDGLFDMTIIPKMNRLKLFSRVNVLYTDNIYNVTGITLHRGSHICVKSEDDIQLEIDGETMGFSDFDFRIIERSIRVIVSEKFINENSRQA